MRRNHERSSADGDSRQRAVARAHKHRGGGGGWALASLILCTRRPVRAAVVPRSGHVCVVCVCVCVRARARARVCVCVCARRALFSGLARRRAREAHTGRG